MINTDCIIGIVRAPICLVWIALIRNEYMDKNMAKHTVGRTMLKNQNENVKALNCFDLIQLDFI